MPGSATRYVCWLILCRLQTDAGGKRQAFTKRFLRVKLRTHWSDSRAVNERVVVVGPRTMDLPRQIKQGYFALQLSIFQCLQCFRPLSFSVAWLLLGYTKKNPGDNVHETRAQAYSELTRHGATEGYVYTRIMMIRMPEHPIPCIQMTS